MRISIVSAVVETTYDGEVVNAEFAKGYLQGTDQSLVVPGVTSWDNIVTEDGEQDGEHVVTLSADLTTDPVVVGNNAGYDGEEPTEAWISEYVKGADAYWLAAGPLAAREVTFA